MLEKSLAPPARAANPALSRDLIAERAAEELARLRDARPHLASRVDRAATVLVMQLSSTPRARPIKCRVRKGGRRVYLVSSLTSGGVTYEVSPADWCCSCPDHHRHGRGCKHSIGCWILARTNTPLPYDRPAEIRCSDCGIGFHRDRLIEAQEGQAEGTLNPGELVCRHCAPRHGLPVPRSSRETTQEAAPDPESDEKVGCGACQDTRWIYLAEDIVDPKSGEVGKATNPVRCRACDPATPPHLSDEEMRKWMGSASWRFAKTMPRHPHEYSLRAWNDEALFERIVKTIWDRGYDRPYLRRVWRSLDVGEHYIWIAGAPPEPSHPAPVKETALINRALRIQDELGETG